MYKVLGIFSGGEKSYEIFSNFIARFNENISSPQPLFSEI
jgi:hypothetical protein